MVILEDTGVYRLVAKLWLTLLYFLNLFEDYFILHAHKGVQVRFRAQLTGVSRFFHHVGPGMELRCDGEMPGQSSGSVWCVLLFLCLAESL